MTSTAGRGGRPLEQARARIVERLRARRAEIDETIFARVSDQWFDQTGSGDPEYVAGLRAAGVAALDYVLVGIEASGQSLEPIPAAALAQARRAARTGVGLDTVLRRYLAGYTVLEGFVMHEAGHDEHDLIPPTQASALRDVLQRMSALVDRLIIAVSSAYKEVERAGDTVLASGDRAAPRERTSRRDRTSRRERILEAMAEVVGERGFGGASVGLVTSRAKVSSRTFYELFDGQKDCFLAVMDKQTERARALVEHAFGRERSWRGGLRAALTSLLVFLDSEPALARVWLVEVHAAGSWALERRARNISRLTCQIVAAWDTPHGWRPPPLAAEGVMTSILGVLHNHVVTGDPNPLISLLGPLMGIMMRPYLDANDVAREIERGRAMTAEILSGRRAWPLPSLAASPTELPGLLTDPRALRARRCVLFIAANPGASNRQVAAGVGVSHQSQVSTLLSRLEALGLLDKRADEPGRPNAWRLTPDGERAAILLKGADASAE
jgi:AcrR family transcriptional regulator